MNIFKNTLIFGAIASLALGTPALAHGNGHNKDGDRKFNHRDKIEAWLNTDLTATQLTCSSDAYIKEQNALMAASNTYHTASMAALATRRDSIVAALKLTVVADRQAALTASYETYAAAQKTNRTNYKNAVSAAKTMVKTELQTCGLSVNASAKVSSTLGFRLF